MQSLSQNTITILMATRFGWIPQTGKRPTTSQSRNVRRRMFENTGLDQRFLADIHTIASSLKAIKEIQGLALVKLANDIGSIASQSCTYVDVCPHCNTEIHYSVRNVTNGMTVCKSCKKKFTACDWCLATHGINERPCIDSGDVCPYGKDCNNE